MPALSEPGAQALFSCPMIRSTAHLAAPIAAANTTAALTVAGDCATAGATLVEYRLDLMADFDLPRLLASSPLPAIITCRAPYQGGRFPGSEAERIGILRWAMDLGAPFVDVEAEALAYLTHYPHPGTSLIGSHHDFGAMIGDWASLGVRLAAEGADVVKLAGMAASTDDVLLPLAWLAGLTRPGIGIAMGVEGLATRLLAPRFANSLLSFAAIGSGTAPGQIDLHEMVQDFGYHHMAAANPCLVLITPPDIPWSLVQQCRRALPGDTPAGLTPWLIPIPVTCFGPGLLLACQLARIDGILCLPTVARDPRLADYGLDPSALTWGKIPSQIKTAASFLDRPN